MNARLMGLAAIDRMTGEELTEKREFVKDGYRLLCRLHEPAKDYKDGIGIRFFHGSVDGAVSVEYSRRMDKAPTGRRGPLENGVKDVVKMVAP